MTHRPEDCYIRLSGIEGPCWVRADLIGAVMDAGKVRVDNTFPTAIVSEHPGHQVIAWVAEPVDEIIHLLSRLRDVATVENPPEGPENPVSRSLAAPKEGGPVHRTPKVS